MASTPSLPLPTPLAALVPTDALSVVKRVLAQIQSHARTLLLPSTVVGCVTILEGSTRAHADAWASGAPSYDPPLASASATTTRTRL